MTQKEEEIPHFSEEEKMAILEKFYLTLLGSQVDLDPEIAAIVNNDNFFYGILKASNE